MPYIKAPYHSDIEVHKCHQASLAIATVSLEFWLTELDLTHPSKGSRRLRFARQVVMYLLHVVYEMNHTHIGKLFSKDRSTVSHACKVIENSRDDGVFDMKLIRLENFLQQAPRPVSLYDVAQGIAA